MLSHLPRALTALGGAVALAASGIAAVALAPTAQAVPAAPTPDCSAKTTCTITYAYTGATQTFTVPAGVTSIDARAIGAAGGNDVRAGKGGVTTAALPVSPGDVLTVLAGQQGSVGDTQGTFGGGGPVTNSERGSISASGGGGSFVFSASGLVLAAGGGGGFSGTNYGGPPSVGGDGGGNVGGTGVGYPIPGFYHYTGATGGTQTAGGTGGTFRIEGDGYATTPGTDGTGPASSPASVGRGGAGGHDANGGAYADGGGGGGGGYYGGGGGGFYQGGGGGSGFLASGLEGTMTAGANPRAGSVSFTWSNAQTTTKLTVDPAAGAKTITQVTLTATVTPLADVTGTPSGTVAFTDGQTTITGCGAVSLGNGAATCTATFTEGAHSFTAVYSGSSGHAPSTSDALSYTVAGAPTFTTTSLPGGTVGVDYAQTVVATGGTKPYAFAVTSGALPAGLALDDETGAITGRPTTAASNPGTFTVSVSDDDDLVRTRDFTIAVAKGTQQLAFTLAPANPKVGTTYVITDLTRGGGSAAAVLTGNDHCSVSGTTVSFTSAGTCTVTATQSGDGNYEAATSVSHGVDVVKQGSSVSLDLGAKSYVFGQPLAADVTVSGPGTVTVHANDAVVDTYDVAAGNPLTATRPLVLDPGTYAIHAELVPSDGVTYAGSSSGTTDITVGAASTTTSLTVQAGSLKASVAAVSPSKAVPAGTVQFSAGGTPVGGPTTLVGGSATLDVVIPAAERQDVTAVFTPADPTRFSGSSGSTARTNPTVTATVSSRSPLSAYGWYRGPVTVTFTCAATSAPVVACPKPVTLSSSGVRTVSRTVHATDGGSTTTAVTIKIDRWAPRVKIKGVRAGSSVTEIPKVRCVTSKSSRERRSAIVGCKLTRSITASGKPGVRRVTWTATATDEAGNVTRKRKSVRLVR